MSGTQLDLRYYYIYLPFKSRHMLPNKSLTMPCNIPLYLFLITLTCLIFNYFTKICVPEQLCTYKTSSLFRHVCLHQNTPPWFGFKILKKKMSAIVKLFRVSRIITRRYKTGNKDSHARITLQNSALKQQSNCDVTYYRPLKVVQTALSAFIPRV